MSSPVAMQNDEIAPPPPTFVLKSYGEPRYHTEGDVCALAFAPDGSLWSVDESGVLRHWSGDGTTLTRHFLSDLETLWCFSPETTLLASANDDLLIWDVTEGQLLHRIAQPCWVSALAFSPDGRTVAIGHDDGSIRFWDARGQALIGEITAVNSAISAIAFSPDGRSVATAAEDRTVRTWDAATHKPIGTFASHTDRIPGLAWSSDSSRFASAGWDTSARVWNPESPDPLMLLNSHSDQVHVVAFAPNGKLLATADSDFDIHLWSNPDTAKIAHVLRGHANEIRCLTFNREGTKLASAGVDRVIHVWDVASGKLIAGPNPTGKHGICTFPANKSTHLASTAGATLRVWDTETGQAVPLAGDAPAYSVAASADGHWLAAGGRDCITRLHDCRQGGMPRLLEATKPPIGAVAFSPDGRTVAHTSPADGLVWLWHTAPHTGDAKLILIEAADGCTLETIAYHPDGNRLAVGGIDYLSTGERDGAVVVWDLSTQKQDLVFDRGVYSVAIDPSGRFVAGAGVTDTVYLWDLTTKDLAFELEGHQQQIHCVAFDPDGNFVLSGGDDCTLRVWDVLSGRLLIVREFDCPIQSLAFGPDGSLFAGMGNTTCLKLDFRRVMDD